MRIIRISHLKNNTLKRGLPAKAGRVKAALLTCILAGAMLAACTRYEPTALEPGYEGESVEETAAFSFDTYESELQGDENTENASEPEGETETEAETEPEAVDTRERTKVKGIYVASKPLANTEFMSKFWDRMDDTELNAVVIDIKDDYGKITYDMQGVGILDELGSVEPVIEDMPGLMKKFKEHGIYTIARIVSMRDPYIGQVKPEWCLTNQDGTVYTDNSGYTWINPYKTEYWDYLLAIADKCIADGFDEIQFDYIRFCTDKGASDCVFDEEETKGRDKISIISEAVQYLSDHIKAQGAFVSCDVFGTIIGSQIDSRSVGQDYPQMASLVDYMCPMIYPSHYAAGNFGLDMPDLHPYDAILGALKRSKSVLNKAFTEGGDYGKEANVRPWLQAFTATWLGSGNYMNYDAAAVRQEIQAVYDAGYDEWILWSAAVSYDFSGFLSPKEAEEEAVRIEESRAAMPPEETEEEQAETFPVELQDALDGDELDPTDEAKLLEDGPIVSYEQ